jgi:hypothetical protein
MVERLSPLEQAAEPVATFLDTFPYVHWGAIMLAHFLLLLSLSFY